jgi:hypothetical protein
LWHAIRTHLYVHCTKISDFLFYFLFFKKIIGAGAYELGSTKTMSLFKYWRKRCDPLFPKNEKGEELKYFF